MKSDPSCLATCLHPHPLLVQVVALREQAAAKRAMDIFDVTDDPEPYIPYSELWPARRRAQRLSFAVWPAIREQNGDLQRVLEAASTSDRLRMAVLRLRALREQIKEP